MIPGSGPGRGTPWWRHHSARWFHLRYAPGLISQEPVPRGEAREGRTVARMPRVDT